MPGLFLPNRKPLVLPGTTKRALRRPDPRGLVVPQLSGAPLSGSEVDYDELDVAATWRVYEPNEPGQVRYFCYELEQLNPGAAVPARYFKAVRLIRLTRVPRYLRNTGPGGGAEAFSAMRDVLVGLREKRILFLNVIAKSPELPLVFAYGVQATGDTIEEAMAEADEAYEALSVGLDGTYQQLEYQPLSMAEGEVLARHQVEWNQIAMARGRPMPQGVALGSSAILDGNRTDVENTNNQLESFIRGMSDRSFMLSLVTVPLAPADMASAWRNISQKLSAARSDQSGSRGVSAGLALPLSTGMSMGDSHGNTHGVTGTQGIGSSDGLSASQADGVSVTHTDGTSQSLSTTHTNAVSASQSDSHSTSTSLGHSTGHTASTATAESASRSDSASAGQSYSEGTNQGVSTAEQHSASASQGASSSHGVSVGQSNSMTAGSSMSETRGVSAGSSLSDSVTAGSNWASSMGKGLSAGQTATSGFGQSMSESLSQAWNLAFGGSDGASAGASASKGGGLNAGLLGFGSNLSEGSGTNVGNNQGTNHGLGVSQTGGGSSGTSISESLARNLGQSLNLGESAGGSLSRASTAGSSVGTSHSLAAGQSLASTVGQSASQTASAGTSSSVGMSQSQSVGSSMGASQGHGLSTGVGQTSGLGQSLSQGQSLAQASSLSQGVSDGRTLSSGQSASVANGLTDGASSSDAVGRSSTATAGASSALSSQQALSDAYMVAMSRQASTTGSLGVVPNVGVSVSKATFDEAKRVVGDILEAQMKRYLDGIEGGGMLYQMFLVCPDRPTLVGASTLLKSAFWGSGGGNSRLPSPFTTEIIDDPEEARRLLVHASAFSSFQRREPVMEIIEPYVYSTYVTTGEASAMCHPPTAESIGIQAQTDSMPVLAMPADRGSRDLYVGHIVNGERGRVSDVRFGIDMSEITHMLIQGTTGLGKTTTMMRLLEQAVRHTREFSVLEPGKPYATKRSVPAGVLALDWMQNMRDLANVVPEDRFQLFSVANPELGAFRFNPLEIPHEGMDAGQWLGAQADQLAASFGLGEFGRSILSEALDELYRANRLRSHELLPEVISPDGSGAILRGGVELPPVSPGQLPPSAIQTDGQGNDYANVYTHRALSRLVGLPDVATIILRKMEEASSQDGARLQGTDMRNRLQSVWRRLQYYAPGSPGHDMVAADPDLDTRECLGVRDLIDPDRGLVTVIETDGLDLENRRVVLGSVMLAVYRYGLHVGKGCFDHGGRGPGTFVVLEEAHELFGDATDGEDRTSATMRANLYESLFRRARATGLRLVAMTQNCGHVPAAITSMTTTVLIHRTYDEADRKRVFSLLNWSNQIGQQMREWRYIGEMPRGYCIVRLDARESYLESAPVQILVDPPDLPPVADETLRLLAARRRA